MKAHEDNVQPARASSFLGYPVSRDSELAATNAVFIAHSSQHPASELVVVAPGVTRWECNCGREHDDGCYVPGTRSTCPFFAFSLHEDTHQVQGGAHA